MTLGGRLSQALPIEGEPMGVVHEPIEDGIGDGWIANDVVPVLDGELACHDRRGAAVAIFHDLQQIAPLLGRHWGKSPVVED